MSMNTSTIISMTIVGIVITVITIIMGIIITVMTTAEKATKQVSPLHSLLHSALCCSNSSAAS